MQYNWERENSSVIWREYVELDWYIAKRRANEVI